MKEVEELVECMFKFQINLWFLKEVESGVQIKGVQCYLEF